MEITKNKNENEIMQMTTMTMATKSYRLDQHERKMDHFFLLC